MKKFFWLLSFGVHLIWAQDVQFPENIQSLGFGSCNRTDLDPKIWETIAGEALDAWVWLGDIVYTDEESMQDLAQKYALQKSLPAYQKLIGKASVFGVWDDHDFAWNDCVASFNSYHKDYNPKPQFKSSKELRQELEWMNEVSAAAVQQKHRDFLEFKNQYFNKKRKKAVKRPRFKSKRDKQSYRLPNQKIKCEEGDFSLRRII